MDKVPLILVVDDEPGIRYFLAETLVEAGYQVVLADSGEAALEQAASRNFDLALMDLRLPGMGGLEVLAALCRLSPDTTVIVLTAHASLETAIEALRHGAHDYLFKPCESAQLRESVAKGLLKRQRQLRHRQVLAQLEERMSGNLESLLVTAFERVLTPAESPDTVPAQGASLAIDVTRHTATLSGKDLGFSLAEFNLLMYLIENTPRVVPMEELSEIVLGHGSEPWAVGDLIRTHIYRIRQKIRKVAPDLEFIRTVRGVGYAFQECAVQKDP
ncbi:MAG: response regulator transcription factor [Anaerolineae bacterium]|nr:response regulator transcription factor [Anaerolineae bacterium]